MDIELLNGAFVSTFEKGENGKPGKWITNPNFKKLGKKKEKKGSEKERPQYPIIEDCEQDSKDRFRETLKEGIMDIVTYLKKISK